MDPTTRYLTAEYDYPGTVPLEVMPENSVCWVTVTLTFDLKKYQGLGTPTRNLTAKY